MTSNAKTVDQYIAELPEDRREAIATLRKEIKKNLPKGFEDGMGYGMIGYYVPHSLYPAGYHCDPKQPLPFMGLASQKAHIAVYHMGVYAMPELEKWYVAEYKKHMPTKPDMGKSCLRFKNPAKIPFKLIGELASKVKAKEWIEHYDSVIAKRGR
jgi:hypothetical protein